MPKSYKSYKADDGSFRIDYPAEWSAEGSGGRGFSWAKFTSGGAEINITTNMIGSLMADIAKSQNAILGVKNEEDLAPVAVVHEQEKQEFEEENGVSEKKAEYTATNVMDARRSEFTGNGSFGGSIHGYRVTALTPDRRIRIVCRCPENEWASLKPAFDQIIRTLAK